MEFLNLNGDCLINLCRYLDPESIVTVSETCSRLKYLAEGYFRFKKSYTCCIGSDESIFIATKTLRKVGMHLTRLDIMFDLQCSLSRPLTQFYNTLVQSVGQNLIELSILGEICAMPLQILAPILSQLEELTLQNLCWEKWCVSRIDLPALCPNLRKLIVCGQIVFAPEPFKSFKQLESLDVVDFASEQIPAEVFAQNRRLTRVNLRHRMTTDNIDLTSFAVMLGNLLKLHLDVKLIENPIEQLPSLSNFSRLQSLELYSIPAASFNGILKILETFVGLREIVLQCHLTRVDSQFSTIQEHLPRLATELKELEIFVTVNIDWTAETVAEFVRHAQKLTYLDFWSGADCNYSVTTEFIRELATIRKSIVYSGMQPLHLKICAKDDDLRQVFNEQDVKNIIKLSRLAIAD